jgi:hypothetical protein
MNLNLLWLVPVLLVAGWILLMTLRRLPRGDSGAEVVQQAEDPRPRKETAPQPVIVIPEVPLVVIRRTTPIEPEPAQSVIASPLTTSPPPTVESQAPPSRRPRLLLDTPEAVQQAIIFQEILGPPLCRRGPGGLRRCDR